MWKGAVIYYFNYEYYRAITHSCAGRALKRKEKNKNKK
jgi:hypothetical protein